MYIYTYIYIYVYVLFVYGTFVECYKALPLAWCYLCLSHAQNARLVLLRDWSTSERRSARLRRTVGTFDSHGGRVVRLCTFNDFQLASPTGRARSGEERKRCIVAVELQKLERNPPQVWGRLMRKLLHESIDAFQGWLQGSPSGCHGPVPSLRGLGVWA